MNMLQGVSLKAQNTLTELKRYMSARRRFAILDGLVAFLEFVMVCQMCSSIVPGWNCECLSLSLSLFLFLCFRLYLSCVCFCHSVFVCMYVCVYICIYVYLCLSV